MPPSSRAVSGTRRAARGPTRVRYPVSPVPGPPLPVPELPVRSDGTPVPSSDPVAVVSHADPGGAWWARPMVAVAGLAVVAFAASLVVGRTLFPLGSTDLDEGVYVYQAHMLLHGLITLPAASYGEFFRPWLSGQVDGRVFTEFQLGLPALLAGFQAVTGSMRLGLAVVAAADVVATYGFAVEITGRRRVAVLAAALLTLSPLVLVQSALILTYLTSLVGLTASGWAFLRATRTGRPGVALVGGVLLGVTVLTRPFDALLFGGPVLALCVWRWWAVRGPVAAAGGLVLPVAVGLVPALVVTAGYNALTTGTPWRFPITAADGLNRFGFGGRQIMRGQPHVTYSVHVALGALRANVEAVPGWLAGGALLLVAAVIGAAVLWRRDGRRAEVVVLVVVALAFPAAYLFQWATLLSAASVTNGIGPQYYLPALVPLAVLGAVGLHAVLAGRPWPVVVAAAIALVAVTGWSVPDKVHDARAVTAAYRNVAAAVPSGPRPSLVFVPSPEGPYVPTPYPFLQTDPALAAPLLVATDRGADDAALMAREPGRRAEVLRTEYRPTDALLHPSTVLVPVRAVGGTSLDVSVAAGALPAGSVAVATLDGAGLHLVDPVAAGSGGAGWVVGTGAGPGTTTPTTTALSTTAVGTTAVGTTAGAGGSGVPTVALHDGSRGALAVGIKLSPSGAARTVWYQERIPYAVTGGRLEVIVPGQGWELTRFPNGAHWLPADVSRHLSVTVRAGGA